MICGIRQQLSSLSIPHSLTHIHFFVSHRLLSQFLSHLFSNPHSLSLSLSLSIFIFSWYSPVQANQTSAALQASITWKNESSFKPKTNHDLNVHSSKFNWKTAIHRRTSPAQGLKCLKNFAQLSFWKFKNQL